MLRFGIRASETPWEVYREVAPILQPLRMLLEQELDRTVVLKIRVFRDYHRVIDAMAARAKSTSGDAARMPQYWPSRKTRKLLLVARHDELDESVIIACRHLGIRTLEDVKEGRG